MNFFIESLVPSQIFMRAYSPLPCSRENGQLPFLSYRTSSFFLSQLPTTSTASMCGQNFFRIRAHSSEIATKSLCQRDSKAWCTGSLFTNLNFRRHCKRQFQAITNGRRVHTFWLVLIAQCDQDWHFYTHPISIFKLVQIWFAWSSH